MVLIDVPVRRVTKRNKRVMSCVEPFIFEEKDELQTNNLNPVMQPASNQHQIVHESIESTESLVHLDSTVKKRFLDSQPNRSDTVAVNGNNGHFLIAESAQSTENNVVLIDVPIRRLTKRNKRVMSCIERFTFEERDEFQEKDSNPVMQPSSNQHKIVHEFIKTTENSVRLNSTLNEHGPVPQKNRHNVHNEHLRVARQAKPTAAKNECMQCFTYKQNISGLKKQIKEIQKNTLVHMSQFDNLQDRCVQLIQTNKTLQEELYKNRRM